MDHAAEPKVPNRRRAPRRKPRGFVKLECRKGSIGLGSNLATTLLDVSETGARLVTHQELAIQQEVEIIFLGYGLRQKVRQLANVRWQLKLDDGKFCLGVEFQKRMTYADWQMISSPS
jgi:hypothetical protein